DPKPADLDHEVFTPTMNDEAVRHLLAQIASEKNPFIPAARSRQKLGLSQFRIVPIPGGEVTTPDGNFTCLALRNFMAAFIEKRDLSTWTGVTDGETLVW